MNPINFKAGNGLRCTDLKKVVSELKVPMTVKTELSILFQNLPLNTFVGYPQGIKNHPGIINDPLENDLQCSNS